jgi:hypothetical protein
LHAAEPRLHSFGVGQPTEEMIEAPVLHHHDNDMLDAGLFRPEFCANTSAPGPSRRAPHQCRPSSSGGSREKIASVKFHGCSSDKSG